MQYLLGTLTPVLDSLHGLQYYYIYNMTLTHLQPCTFTSAQDRSGRKQNKDERMLCVWFICVCFKYVCVGLCIYVYYVYILYITC